MNDSQDKKQVHKLYLEIYPELISSTYKSKQLNNYAVWSVLKAVDKNKKGSGKFQFETVLFIIAETLKVSKKYSYEIFKKGTDVFWKFPSKNREVYLMSLDKVIEKFPHEIAKTAPFKIRINDLWKQETPGQLKTFLLDFVLGRYGQKKPISKASLCENLGCSESTIKRQIRNSINLTKKINLEKIDEFDHINFANEYLNKLKILYPQNKTAYKILKERNKFVIYRQLSNSYSMEDYSRLKLSKRPKSMKKIDSELQIQYEKRKYYIGKCTNSNHGALSKVDDGKSAIIWQKIVNENPLPLNTQYKQNKTRTRCEAKFWLKKEMNQEC